MKVNGRSVMCDDLAPLRDVVPSPRRNLPGTTMPSKVITEHVSTCPPWSFHHTVNVYARMRFTAVGEKKKYQAHLANFTRNPARDTVGIIIHGDEILWKFLVLYGDPCREAAMKEHPDALRLRGLK